MVFQQLEPVTTPPGGPALEASVLEGPELGPSNFLSPTFRLELPARFLRGAGY